MKQGWGSRIHELWNNTRVLEMKATKQFSGSRIFMFSLGKKTNQNNAEVLEYWDMLIFGCYNSQLLKYIPRFQNS